MIKDKEGLKVSWRSHIGQQVSKFYHYNQNSKVKTLKQGWLVEMGVLLGLSPIHSITLTVQHLQSNRIVCWCQVSLYLSVKYLVSIHVNTSQNLNIR